MSIIKKAVVLLSGGLDSTTTLAIAKSQNYDLYTLTFRYGQRHELEVQAARKVSNYFNVKDHLIADIDLRLFGGSALTDDISVPKDRSIAEMNAEVPVTYVPARNTILLSFALAWAEVLKCNDIFIGVNALDYSGYPDCRPEYIEAYQQMARLATKAGVEGQELNIHTPLIKMTKAEIIQNGVMLGADYSLTLSCYDPTSNGEFCGKCDSCQLRLKGFAEAGLADPGHYFSMEKDSVV